MNKILRISSIIIVVLIGAAALLWTGVVFGRNLEGAMNGYGSGYDMMGPALMGYNDQGGDNGLYGYGMMGGRGGYGSMGPGMMGSYGGGLTSVDPLSIDEARIAIESYLVSFGNDDLAIEEIMVFDNNAYAIVIEESTGIGAFELLVDPVTKVVFPEYGPNMMWNLKYGTMSGFGGYGMMGTGMMMGNGYGSGGMMGSYGFNDSAEVLEVSADMPVDTDEAAQVAQIYLDTNYPGVAVSDEITAFYGYYTIDLERDGSIIGMLSVNGYTSQVFIHTWHGDFLEMSEMSEE